MGKRFVLLPAVLALCSLHAWGQASYAASRLGDLQIGAGYSSANADYEYVHDRIAGPYIYTDFDFKAHFGVEASFHQLNDPNSAVYQRSYEIGGRYLHHLTLGKLDLNPYGKVLAGRGVLNFPKYANLAYNLVSVGGGVDVPLRRRLNLRVEYEYQDWLSTPGAGLTITPSMLTIGVAYHFPGGVPYALHR